MARAGTKKSKTQIISAEGWQRARDLVAAGRLSYREIALECGINRMTLVRRSEKDGWYDPRKETESMPPPPPKLVSKLLDKKKTEDAIDPERPVAPDRQTFKDMSAWCQEMLRWAIEGVAKHARTNVTGQCFLVEKMPGAIKALAAAGPGGGSIEEEAAALRIEMEERMKAVQAPVIRKFDLGEVPDKRQSAEDG